jgi:two-component system, OmpR family, sensor histidine kinase VicK
LSATRSPVIDRRLQKSGRVETKVIRAGEAAERAIVSFLKNAAADKEPYVGSITDRHNPARAKRLLETIGQLKAQNPAFVGKYITDIQNDNIDHVRDIMSYGIQVRHIEGNSIGFSVSEHEYLNHYQETSGPLQEQQLLGRNELVYSNNRDLVMQMRQVFDILWRSALPAETRIKQLELGIGVAETRIVTDIKETTELAWQLMKGLESELDIIVASDRMLQRNTLMFNELIKLAGRRGVRIRILSPYTDVSLTAPEGVEWRRTTPIATGMAIYDRKNMLITQYIDPEAQTGNEAVLANIYTTDKRTISGMRSLFDALWNESEMRSKEVRQRTQAELLQDILTHDIRNYNQIALASAELLAEELGDVEGAQAGLKRVIAALQGSTGLVDKASRLGKILAESGSALAPIDLKSTLAESIRLVKDSNPGKKVSHRIEYQGADGAANRPLTVMADDLLGEALVNIYSNCVKYTQGDKVPIETVVDRTEVDEEGMRRRMWRISISDRGNGIPDNVKSVFTRYRTSTSGKGLGLSIVHALIVGRYSGRIEVKDRIEGDHSKGACIQILLPMKTVTPTFRCDVSPSDGGR